MIVGSNILAGASGQQGYFLNRSVRTRSSASAYFNRTNGTPTSATTWTWSGWIKRGILGTQNNLTGAGQTSGINYTAIVFNSDNTLQVNENGAGTNFILQTTQVFRDPSSWYHIIIAVDTTQATASNRIKLYINGVQVTAFSTATYPTLNYVTYFNSASYIKAIGNIWYNGTPGGFYYDGYLTEINFIDGQQLAPTSFGEYNTITGVWQPKKYGGTYGTNGFYLNFNDNSAATAAAIGKDSSGNGNNWTPNNISVTAGVTYDSMTDVPTLTSATQANYAVLNPLYVVGSAKTFADGNLKCSGTANAGAQAYGKSTIEDAIGKFYLEAIPTNLDSTTSSYFGGFGGGASGSTRYYSPTGQVYNGSSWVAYGASYTTNDIIGLAVDTVAGTMQFFKNNVSQGQITGLSLSAGFTAFSASNAASVVPSWTFNFGQRPFSYTPPTGFVALNTYNLPTPTIANGAKQFAASIYTGTGVAQNINNSVNGISFQPDLVWVKARSFAYSHRLANSITGATNYLDTAQTSGQFTDAGNSISSFNSNGFGVGTYVSANNNTTTYVGWQWKASNAAAVTNTSGTGTSSVSANPTAGFSIVTMTNIPTATGTNTYGHGINIAPELIIFKNINLADDWYTYHVSLGNAAYIRLNSTAAQTTAATMWGNTSPTSSVFTLRNGSLNSSTSQTILAYCFASIAGYSKIGSYTGNGSADGAFIYTGFRPRFILAKSATTAATNWFICDTTRSPQNVADEWLLPNGANVEQSNIVFDILSNGFKLRNSAAEFNTNASTYIYIAFAENPFNYSLAR